MRTPLALLAIAIFTAIFGPVVLVAGLFGVEEKADGIYQRCMHLWCRNILRWSGVKLVVHNPERMSPPHEGSVYMINHVSWYDVFAAAAVIPRYTWIAKAELSRIPLFSQAARAAGIIFINRDNRKSSFESYKIVSADVKRGRSAIICPEGTRGHDYHLRPFKKGPFVLAIAAEAKIIPALLYGTREIMGKGSYVVRGGTVHIHFLESVSTAGLSYDDRTALMLRVHASMAAEMERLYGVHTAEHAIAAEGERKE
jgi:1-acyl-sn-glycerol-3-phosphate acyltransferase